jgi:hypothetical protein
MKNLILGLTGLGGLLLVVVGILFFATNLEKGFSYFIFGIILFAASDLIRRFWRK